MWLPNYRDVFCINIYYMSRCFDMIHSGIPMKWEVKYFGRLVRNSYIDWLVSSQLLHNNGMIQVYTLIKFWKRKRSKSNIKCQLPSFLQKEIIRHDTEYDNYHPAHSIFRKFVFSPALFKFSTLSFNIFSRRVLFVLFH